RNLGRHVRHDYTPERSVRAGPDRRQGPRRNFPQRGGRLPGTGARCAGGAIVNKNLRWKFVVILGVIALSVWSFYPPSRKVNLGLDLRGGVHMVMRVQTDAALRIETETTVERLRETVTRGGIQYSKLEVTGPTTFVV